MLSKFRDRIFHLRIYGKIDTAMYMSYVNYLMQNYRADRVSEVLKGSFFYNYHLIAVSIISKGG